MISTLDSYPMKAPVFCFKASGSMNLKIALVGRNYCPN